MTPNKCPHRPETSIAGASQFDQQRSPRQAHGFALAVVLLLASVVLGLVVAMSLMTQMQLKAAAVVVSETKARQDALLGMRVALGQIQKELGPDQRTTFRSDFFVNLSNSQDSYSTFGTPIAQPYWTGVLKTYRPGGSSIGGGGNPSQELDVGYDESNFQGANLRSWAYGLSSGGATTVNASLIGTLANMNTAAREGTDAPDQGGVQWLVSAPSNLVITGVSTNRLSPLSTNQNVTPPDGPAIQGVPTKLVLSTLDKDTAAYRTLARVEDVNGYSHAVRAYKVGIQGDPVLGSGTVLTGNYAYWVSDEGMKAKATLTSPWTNSVSPLNYPINQLNFTVPQRMAVEKIPLDPTTAPKNPLLSGIGSNQLPGLNPIVNASQAGFTTALAQATSLASLANVIAITDKPNAAIYASTLGRFLPDITVYSQGVLADVRKGGLKVDLTAAFEGTVNTQYNNLNETPVTSLATNTDHHSLLGRVRAEFPTTLPTGDQQYDEKVYHVGVGPTTFQYPALLSITNVNKFKNNGLRWDTLFLYYNLYKAGGSGGLPDPYLANTFAPNFSGVGTGTANGAATMRLYNYNTTVHEAALVPRILDFQVYFAFNSRAFGGGWGLALQEYPSLVLYNPYNITLNSLSTYQFSLFTGVTPQLNLVLPASTHQPTALSLNLPSGGNNFRNNGNNPNNAFGNIPGSNVYTYAFIINPTTSGDPTALQLDPGEVRVYTLADGTQTQELAPHTGNVGYFDDLTDTGSSTITNYHWVYVSDGLTPNDTAILDNSETITVSQSSYTHSSDYGYYSMSVPNNGFTNEWPSTNGATTQDLELSNYLVRQGPVQQLGKVMFRGFAPFPVNPAFSYIIGGGYKNLGAIAFFSKGAVSRGFADNPSGYSNSGGFGAFLPLFNPSVPIFASVAPQANPFALYIDTGMSDGMTQLDPTISSSTIYSVQGVKINGHLDTYWGRDSLSDKGLTHVIMRDVPRTPMTSLGQFMHINLNYWVTDMSTTPQSALGGIASFDGGDGGPLNPVGGSLAPANFRGVAAVTGSAGYYDDTGNPTYFDGVSRMEKAEHRYEPNSSFNNALTGVAVPNTVDIWVRDDNFLANEALFDTYYFSTVPSANWTSTQQTTYAPKATFNQQYVAAAKPLPNARLKYYTNSGAPPTLANLHDLDQASANLMLNGAFNINSTSVDAWVALLSSLSGNPLPIWNNAKGQSFAQTVQTTDLKNPILRFTAPINTWELNGGPSSSPADVVNHPFQGVRGLSDGEIRDLALKIVEQIKLRGPFLSMGDFLNRRLVNDTSQPYWAGNGTPNVFNRGASSIGSAAAYTVQTNFSRKGALQAAIDESTVNDYLIPSSPTGSPSQPPLPAGYSIAYPTGSYASLSEPAGAGGVPSGGGLMNLQGISDANAAPGNTFGTTHFMYRLQDPLIVQNLPQLTATGIPGWLMQQDIVEDFSSVMAARSDTFVVRFYGETTNPTTGSVDARAYGEAVVQRYPDFMDTSVPAATKSYGSQPVQIQNHLYSLITPGGANFNPLIYAFGRRFRVVSIRWLSATDI